MEDAFALVLDSTEKLAELRRTNDANLKGLELLMGRRVLRRGDELFMDMDDEHRPGRQRGGDRGRQPFIPAKKKESGLTRAHGILKDREKLSITRLDGQDVVRTPLIRKTIKAHDESQS